MFLLGISNALYLTPEIFTVPEIPLQPLLNVQVAPKFDAPRIALSKKTTLSPTENRETFRAYIGSLKMSRPSLALLISLRNDGYLDVHAIRHKIHTAGDIQGAISLGIHMNEATHSQLNHSKKISKGAIHEHCDDLRETFVRGGDVEHAYLIIDEQGTRRIGRQELFIEALYAFACRKEHL